MDKNLKAISLFSGCGGADLGLIGGFTYLGKKYNKDDKHNSVIVYS